MMTTQALPTGISERLACQVLDLCRNTLRSLRQRHYWYGPPKPASISQNRRHSTQPRALSQQERTDVLRILNSEQYRDQPPMQVYHDLLQQGRYHCSISTMHRLLRSRNLAGERRKQRPAQPQPVPRLRATAPNEVWTWDITKLATLRRGQYLSLYVIMDLYSRFIVAWMLSRKENSALASHLIAQAADRYLIAPDSLTLHQDRGMPMTAHCYLDLLSELAITASHSRPRVSNDNAMSEAQFKTLKYQPDYPRRFDNYDHAMRWCKDYVHWYNYDHHHSALAGFTPAQVFTGKHVDIAARCQQALDASFSRHPEHFTKGRPLVRLPAEVVTINPIPERADQSVIDRGVNFPTLERAMRKAS